MLVSIIKAQPGAKEGMNLMTLTSALWKTEEQEPDADVDHNI